MELRIPHERVPSPTLIPGREYLSVVLGVPAPLRASLESWRSRHVPDQAVPPHITVFIAEADRRAVDAHGTWETLRRAAARVEPFTVGLQGAGSFLPVSPVAFLELDAGAQQLHALHRACAQRLPDASPFPFRPHLTIAQELSEDLLGRALRDFAGHRGEFPARSLEVFHGNQAAWRRVGSLPLGRGQG